MISLLNIFLKEGVASDGSIVISMMLDAILQATLIVILISDYAK